MSTARLASAQVKVRRCYQFNVCLHASKSLLHVAASFIAPDIIGPYCIIEYMPSRNICTWVAELPGADANDAVLPRYPSSGCAQGIPHLEAISKDAKPD